MARAWSTTSPSWYSAEPAFCGEDRPRGRCPRVTAVRCFTTHLGIRLRRILSCAASGAAGTRPFGIPSFGGIGVLGFSSCLADTPRRDDRPPTYFFVKKKFIPIGDAESFERVQLRSHSVRGRGFVRRTQEGAFFFTKKAYCGNQTVCVAGGESVQT